MRILISALYTTPEVGYGKGGSQKYYAHLIEGLKANGNDVVVCDRNNLGIHMNSTFDMIITSHLVLDIVNKFNIKGFKIHIMQGIIKEEQYRIGADKYVSISEEVRKFNLDTFGIDSVVINQPYIFNEIKNIENIKLNKKLPLNILFIKGNSSVANFKSFSNSFYNIIESDQNKCIFEQIKDQNIALSIGVGRSTMDSIACGKPCIVADHRAYMDSSKGDGLLTASIFDESLRFNFNGKSFNIDVSKTFIDREVGKYLESFEVDDMILLYNEFKHKFDYRLIAKQMCELKEK